MHLAVGLYTSTESRSIVVDLKVLVHIRNICIEWDKRKNMLYFIQNSKKRFKTAFFCYIYMFAIYINLCYYVVCSKPKILKRILK